MRRWLLVLAAALLTALTVIAPPWLDRLDGPAEDPRPTEDEGENLLDAESSASAPHLRGRGGRDAAAMDTDPVAARQGRSLLVGTVFAEDSGEALRGVRVRLGRARSPAHGTSLAEEDPEEWFVPDRITEFPAEQVTGSDGKFSFLVQGRSGWAVLASKEGYGDAIRTTNTWRAMKPREKVELDLTLFRSHSVRLQVVDTADDPVPGATVTRYGGWCDRPPTGVVQTDRNGWFRITASRDDVLVVQADGFARRRVNEILERDGAPIVLSAPYKLEGVVVDGADAPIEGALVWTDRDEVPLRVTDAAGRFAWDDLSLDPRRERVDVRAWAAGRLSADELAVPGQTDVRIVLFRPGVLAGRFVFPGEGDARPCNLRVAGPRNFGQLTQWEEPRFRVTGIPPGTLSLTAEALRPITVWGKGHAVRAFQGRIDVERHPGTDLEDLTIWLEPVAISYVVSRVLDEEGNPIRGGGQSVSSPWGGATSRRTDANGVIFTAVAVAPGTRTTVSPWAVVTVYNGTRRIMGAAVPVPFHHKEMHSVHHMFNA